MPTRFTTDKRQLTTDSQQVMTKSSVGFFTRCMITLILIVLGCWLLQHNWQLRRIRYQNYNYTADEVKKLRNFPDAQFAYGMRAWRRGDARNASKFFYQVVSKSPLQMDAWLRLAESEAALGHPDKSRKILIFVNHLVSGGYRWKWSQMLLAQDLEMDDVFLKNANELLEYGKLTQDTLRLLDLYFGSDSAGAADALEPDNLVPYLKWLMHWGRVDDTGIVWQRILRAGEPDEDVVLPYTHFLVSTKEILAAQKVWRQLNGTDGITNPGFEKKITRSGFDWRYSEDKRENWEIRRINSTASDESHALRVWFAGEENISFHHLYQIVPVVALESYRLSYKWKSKWITTDQGPFFEIFGYDQKGLYSKGPMINGTNLWQTETLEFTPPAECNAVVVRLRRLKSHRFDSKIAGTLWLDDFKLQKVQSADLSAIF